MQCLPCPCVALPGQRVLLEMQCVEYFPHPLQERKKTTQAAEHQPTQEYTLVSGSPPTLSGHRPLECGYARSACKHCAANGTILQCWPPLCPPSTGADQVWRKLMSVCKILGSASVDVSPSWSSCPPAILRSTRRMILPLRVLGSPGAYGKQKTGF